VSARPRKAKVRPAPRPERLRETLYYVVELAGWDCDFFFGVNRNNQEREGPYTEYRHLVIRGLLLRPKRIKTADVEISLLPDHDNE
jgi:hypothetical protein